MTLATPRRPRYWVVLAALVAVPGCAQFGFTNRVLWHVPSPDGSSVAVCQEVPVFDGPSYDIRLERPDGALLRPLYQIGDGDPCSEVVWSGDSQTLAVLSSHVARVIFVDVKWALDNPDVRTAGQRMVSFGGERDVLLAQHLRFVAPSEIAIELCPYSLEERRRTGELRCSGPAEERQVQIPLPIGNAHKVISGGSRWATGYR